MPLAVAAFNESVAWDWRSETNPDLSTRLRRPTLTAYSRGRAVWRWTPLADDAGPQEVVFSATKDDATGSASLTFTVEAGSEMPVFREPVGEGTTLDLRQTNCVQVSVVVESTSSPRADLSLREAPTTARLLQTGDLTGELAFCPSPAEIMADDVYPLTIAAAVGKDTIEKTYVIVLRRP